MVSRLMKWVPNMAAYLIVVIGIIALIDYLSVKHSKRFDLSENEIYSLSSQTVNILKNLDREIAVLAFMQEGDTRIRPKRLFEEYRYHTSKFSWEFIDPDKSPLMAEKYGIKQYGTYIVEEKGVEKGRKEGVTGLLSEDSLTNALIRVLSDKRKKVYFVKGHGEKDINGSGSNGYGEAKVSLLKENFLVETLLLGSLKQVPEDADVLIVAGPEKDLFGSELDMLGKYIDDGGNLLFMVDPFTVKDTLKFLNGYGVYPSNDIIVDKFSRAFGGDYLMPAVGTYSEEHSITREFGLITIYPLARSIKTNLSGVERIQAKNLAFTLPGTWGETSREKVERGIASMDEKEDNVGPLVVAVAVEVDPKKAHGDKEEVELDSHGHPLHIKESKGLMVVIGDSDFVADPYIGSGGNRDFFMNVVEWLAGDEDKIAIRPREGEMDPLLFSDVEIGMLAFFSIVGIPAIIGVAGVWVNIRRRRT